MSSAPAVKEYIANKANTTQDETVRTLYQQLRDLYDKKLWHQLTLKLVQLVKLPYFDNGRELVELYDRFIRDFESKINQLELVKIALSIKRQITDLSEVSNWLQKISEKINPNKEKEAYAFILSEVAWTKLLLHQIDETRQLTEKVSSILDTITGADPIVYSAYYRVLSLFYKQKIMSTEFYRNSLLYLVYTPLEAINVHEQAGLAFDMGLAALISTDIHNFGELLAHPILKSLDNTKHAWLKEFLFAFNAGDLDKFEHLLSTHKAQIEQQPALINNQVLLREKISILALIELVFNKSAGGRTVPFNVIAQATKLKLEEVELLVMKALSVKLIRGEIDEVNQTVSIHWVQPRVLDLNQITKMRDRVADWTTEVGSVLNYMQNETAPELLT